MPSVPLLSPSNRRPPPLIRRFPLHHAVASLPTTRRFTTPQLYPLHFTTPWLRPLATHPFNTLQLRPPPPAAASTYRSCPLPPATRQYNALPLYHNVAAHGVEIDNAAPIPDKGTVFPHGASNCVDLMQDLIAGMKDKTV